MSFIAAVRIFILEGADAFIAFGKLMNKSYLLAFLCGSQQDVELF